MRLEQGLNFYGGAMIEKNRKKRRIRNAVTFGQCLLSHESKKAKRSTAERKKPKLSDNISKKRVIAYNESYPYQLLYRIVSIFNYTSWT